MDQIGFERWIRRILETEDDEISCTDCFELISNYVDLEVSGKIVAAISQLVASHLKQCLACREEYETLRDLARLEAAGNLPTLEELLNPAN